MDTLLSEPVTVKRVRRTTRQLYRPLDIHSAKAEAWPDAIPELTDAEAIKAARLLYRRFFVKRWEDERSETPNWRRPAKALPVVIDRKINYAQFAGGALRVNPQQGWRGTVHSLSHRFHSRLRPKDRPHSDSHRHLEKEMIAHAVSGGWLDGKLKPAPRIKKPAKLKPDPVDTEHERVLARIKSWETKAKRAATALVKLRKAEKKLARKRAAKITFTL